MAIKSAGSYDGWQYLFGKNNIKYWSGELDSIVEVNGIKDNLTYSTIEPERIAYILDRLSNIENLDGVLNAVFNKLIASYVVKRPTAVIT